jgi:hypothetical protein
MFLDFMLQLLAMKIRTARDHLEDRGDQTSPIKCLMWPGLDGGKMVLAQML